MASTAVKIRAKKKVTEKHPKFSGRRNPHDEACIPSLIPKLLQSGFDVESHPRTLTINLCDGSSLSKRQKYGLGVRYWDTNDGSRRSTKPTFSSTSCRRQCAHPRGNSYGGNNVTGLTGFRIQLAAARCMRHAAAAAMRLGHGVCKKKKKKKKNRTEKEASGMIQVMTSQPGKYANLRRKRRFLHPRAVEKVTRPKACLPACLPRRISFSE